LTLGKKARGGGITLSKSFVGQKEKVFGVKGTRRASKNSSKKKKIREEQKKKNCRGGPGGGPLAIWSKKETPKITNLLPFGARNKSVRGEATHTV